MSKKIKPLAPMGGFKNRSIAEAYERMNEMSDQKETFETFVKSRKFYENLYDFEKNEDEENRQGFVYLSAWIVNYYPENKEEPYHVQFENVLRDFQTLDSAERYLWDLVKDYYIDQ